MNIKNIVIISVLVILLLIYKKSKQPVSLGYGVKAPDAPIQKNLKSSNKILFDDVEITPLAEFEIKAKVILREDYSYDKEAEFSPTDLALGWGRMSDEKVLEQIDFSQSGRWYRYSYKTAPIPQKEIQTHSANMHLIPANDYLADQIDEIKAGQIIKIDGKLVEVFQPSTKYRWKSSLSREDTGGGACEIIFVEQLQILEG